MSIINEQKLFSSLRRLFGNSVSEAIGELLQNSQRAHAHRVEMELIDDEEVIFRYHDDGDGLSSWESLIVIGGSEYDAAVLADQHPMGLGCVALLALDCVARVTIQSKGEEYDVETARYWSDAAYRDAWRNRLRVLTGPGDTVAAGTALTVWGTAALREGVIGALQGYWSRTSLTNPALGYDDLLEITLNGAPVHTAVPDEYALPYAAIQAAYQGCPVRIALDGDQRRLTINWYGQLIAEYASADSALQHLGLYVVVRQGRPLNPKAPTRSGLIHDAAYQAFRDWVIDQVFGYVCGREQEQVTPAQVALLYWMDRARAERDCPYAVLAHLDGDDDHPGSVEEIDHTTKQVVAKSDLATYALVRARLWVDDGDGDPHYYQYGSGRLAAAIDDDLYYAVHGATARYDLIWRPGAANGERGWIRDQPGRWALRPLDQGGADDGDLAYDADALAWRPFADVSAGLVAFDQTYSGYFSPEEVIVCAPNVASFLAEFYWGFTSENQDDEDRDSFSADIDKLIRELRGLDLPAAWTWEMLRYQHPGYFNNDKAAVVTIDLEYAGSHPSAYSFPNALTLRFSDGTAKRLLVG